MRRTLALFSTVLVAVSVASCADDSANPLLQPDDPLFRPSENASGIAQIQVRINELFPQPERRDALHTFAQIKNAVATGDLDGARTMARSLIEFALDTDLRDPKGPETTDEALARLTEELFNFVGLNVAVAEVVDPDETEVVTSPEEDVGAEFPAGSSDEPFVAVIQRVELGSGEQCLPTSRPQREGCYEFTTVPELPSFDELVTVGLCFDDSGLTAEQIDRYRLYKYSDGDANVIALDNVPVSFLECEEEIAFAGDGILGRLARAALGLVAPQKAYAADRGLGGLVGSFSRIGWAGSTLLVYGPSLGASNPAFGPHSEQTLAEEVGHYVDVADETTWAAMSATGIGGFADYDAIVLGEGSGPMATAEANNATWGSVISGHVVVSTLHAVRHHCAPAECTGSPQFDPSAGQFVRNALDWVARGNLDGQPWTGLYAGLGTRYFGLPASPPTQLTLLSSLGYFEVIGRAGTYFAFGDSSDDVVLTDPGHPIFDGITDADVSGWFLSLHEFIGAFPVAEYTVVATGLEKLYLGDPGTVRTGIVVKDVFNPPPSY